jgi:hypothetical protein
MTWLAIFSLLNAMAEYPNYATINNRSSITLPITRRR